MLVVTIFVRSSYNNQADFSYADFSYADYVTSSLRREGGGGVGGVVGEEGGQNLRIRLSSHVVGGVIT